MSVLSGLTLPLPVGGLNEQSGYERQPPNTTSRVSNVVPFSPGKDRLQLAIRPGLSKYIARDFSGEIVAAHALIRTNEQIAYTLQTPTADWRQTTPGRGFVNTIDTDLQGNVYCSDGFSTICKYNAHGELLWAYRLDGVNKDQIIKRLKLDGRGSLFVCATDIRTATVNPGYVKRFEIRDDGLREIWTITEPDIIGDIFDLDIIGDSLVFVETLSNGNYNLHRYDGIGGRRPYRVWKYEHDATAGWGGATNLDGGAPAFVRIDDALDIWVGFPTLWDTTGTPALVRPGGFMVHTGGGGVPVWDSPLVADWAGWGLVVGRTHCWSYGMNASGGTDTITVAKWPRPVINFIPDAALPPPPSPSPTWTRAYVDYNTPYQGPQTITVDDQEAVYVAFEHDGVATNSKQGIVRIKPDGSGEDWYIKTDPTLSISGLSGPGLAVVLDYRRVGVDGLAEFVLAGVGQNIVRLKQYAEAISDLPSRETLIVVASGTTLKFHNLTSNTSMSPSGSGTIDSNQRYTQVFSGFNIAFVLDGERALVYEPTVGADGRIRPWQGTKGEFPRRVKLGCVAMGRAFVGRPDTSPQVWYASARDDFFDWDFFPIDESATQAVVSNTSEAGNCPDIINAMIPMTEDSVLFGCETSIWILRGDPGPGNGGRLDRVSDEIGIAYGNAWCKDDEGVLYFKGSRGGIYAMTPGSVPAKISNFAIDRRLQDLDLRGVRVSLGWDYRQQALVILNSRLNQSTGVQPDHLLWSKRNRGWWPFRFASNAHNSLVLVQVDDDQAVNRHLVMPGRDGFLRRFDRTARSDDGTAIEAEFWTMPMQAAGDQAEAYFTDFRGVLDTDTTAAGCQWNAYGLDRAELPASPSPAITSAWGPGRNPAVWERVRGSTVAVRCHSNSTTAYWAVEEITASLKYAGRAKTL